MIGQVVLGTVYATIPSPKKAGANNAVLLKLPSGELPGHLYFRRCAGDTFEEQVITLDAISKTGTEVEVLVGSPIKILVDGQEIEVLKCSQLAAQHRRWQEWAEQRSQDRTEFDARVVFVKSTYVVVELEDGIKGTLHVSRMTGSPDEAAARLKALKPGDTMKVVVVPEAGGHRRVRVAEVA
jgi:ribosomal protein S1